MQKSFPSTDIQRAVPQLNSSKNISNRRDALRFRKHRRRRFAISNEAKQAEVRRGKPLFMFVALLTFLVVSSFGMTGVAYAGICPQPQSTISSSALTNADLIDASQVIVAEECNVEATTASSDTSVISFALSYWMILIPLALFAFMIITNFMMALAPRPDLA